MKLLYTLLIGSIIHGVHSSLQYKDDPQQVTQGCQTLLLEQGGTDQSSWTELLPVKRNKWIFPFSVKSLDEDVKFYIEFKGMREMQPIIQFSFSKNGAKIWQMTSEEQEVENTGLMPALLGDGIESGFWIRLRQRSDAAYTSLYYAGSNDEIANSNVADPDFIRGDRWRLVLEKGKIEFKWNCSSKLGGPCSTDTQCLVENTVCERQGRMGVCNCDGSTMEVDGECRDISKDYGEPCTSQKECIKMEGFCKMDKIEQIRTCQCGGGMEYSEISGECTDNQVQRKTEKHLDFDRMTREKTFWDMFPGRPEIVSKPHGNQPKSYDNRPNEFMPQCGLGALLEDKKTVLASPIKWTNNGFVVAGFYRTRDETPANIQLTFYSGGHLIPGDKVMTVSVGNEVILKEGAQETRQPGVLSRLPGIAWFYVEYKCAEDGSECQLSAGVGKGKEVQDHTFKPVYQHMDSPTGPGIDTVSVGSDGHVEVALACMGKKGKFCAHNAQCFSGVCQRNRILTPVCN